MSWAVPRGCTQTPQGNSRARRRALGKEVLQQGQTAAVSRNESRSSILLGWARRILH